MKFAEKVRAARLNIGYTQKQLAEIMLRSVLSSAMKKGKVTPGKEKPTQPLQMLSMLKQTTS